MSGIELSHGRTGANLGMAKPPVDHLIFRADEAIVEIHVMRGENCVAHEICEAIRDLREDWGIGAHLVGYPRNPRDISRDVTLRIDERGPFANDLTASHFDGANLCHTVQACSSACGFDIDDDIGLIWIYRPRDLQDICAKASGSQLPQTGELIAPDDVACRFDLNETCHAVFDQHEVWKAIFRPAPVLRHQAQHMCHGTFWRVGDQGFQPL